jgi:SAM-dependent methyltransferase/uncharacterized protein YbaR (Trm112 family)
VIRAEDLDRLACPDCPGAALDGRGARGERGRLTEGALLCASCGTSFSIEEGVPWLMPSALQGARRHGAETFPEEWRRWGERLDGFRDWRARTWEGGDAIERRSSAAVAERRRDAFAAFCGSIRGRALEVACGDGHLRNARGFRAGEYWGIDPMPVTGAAYDFPFVAGVGERLPFRAGVFDAVLVKDSLHHFQDPGRFLDEARRVTSPGGRLVVCQGIETAPGAERSSPGGSRLLRRASTALRLLFFGDLAELRARAARAMRSAAGEGAAAGEDPFVWHLKREDVEFEVRRRYEVRESRLDGNVLYLEGRA